MLAVINHIQVRQYYCTTIDRSIPAKRGCDAICSRRMFYLALPALFVVLTITVAQSPNRNEVLRDQFHRVQKSLIRSNFRPTSLPHLIQRSSMTTISSFHPDFCNSPSGHRQNGCHQAIVAGKHIFLTRSFYASRPG